MPTATPWFLQLLHLFPTAAWIGGMVAVGLVVTFGVAPRLVVLAIVSAF